MVDIISRQTGIPFLAVADEGQRQPDAAGLIALDAIAKARQTVTIRLIQRVLLGPEYAPGNAYWHNLKLE